MLLVFPMTEKLMENDFYDQHNTSPIERKMVSKTGVC